MSQHYTPQPYMIGDVCYWPDQDVETPEDFDTIGVVLGVLMIEGGHQPEYFADIQWAQYERTGVYMRGNVRPAAPSAVTRFAARVTVFARSGDATNAPKQVIARTFYGHETAADAQAKALLWTVSHFNGGADLSPRYITSPVKWPWGN